LAKEADQSAPYVHGEVNQNKPIGEEPTKNFFAFVGIEVKSMFY
jgi:hypothetical protein